MAFVRSGAGSRSYIKYADCEAGEVLVEGYYVGEETSKFKNQLYVFKKEDGNVVCLNATGKLTKWIDECVNTGDLVQIVYAGKVIIAKGPMAGKEAHDFEFYIDSERAELVKEKVQAVSGPQTGSKPKLTSSEYSKFADEAL